MDIPLKEMNSGTSGSGSRRGTVVANVAVTGFERENASGGRLFSLTRSESVASSSSNSSDAREAKKKSESVGDERGRRGGGRKAKEEEAEEIAVTSPFASERRGSSSSSSSSGTDETSSSPSNRSRGLRQALPRSGHMVRVREEEEEEEEGDRRIASGDAKNRKTPLPLPRRPSGLDLPPRVKLAQSENVSYRERIRDRFNAVKERAVESLSRPGSRSQSRLRTIVAKQMAIKMEDIWKREEDELDAAVKRRESVRHLRKEAECGDAKRYDESCEFFAGPREDAANPARESTCDADSSSETNDGSDGKVLASELLGVKEDWEMCEFKKAAPWNDVRDRRERATKILFRPSARAVPSEEKMESGVNPRYPEDEGIYVGEEIPVSRSMKNKMERRLLTGPEGRKWFETNGELVCRRNPLVTVRMREDADGEHGEREPVTTFKAADATDATRRYVNVSRDAHYILDLDISAIQFSHHPLFSREHVVAHRLKEFFVKYKKRKEVDNLSRCRGRLEALRKTRDNLRRGLKGSGDDARLDLGATLKKYEEDIKEARRMRNLEGRIGKELEDKILSTWKDLSQLRELQGYHNTDVKLVVQEKTRRDANEEKAAWAEEIDREADEIYDELVGRSKGDGGGGGGGVVAAGSSECSDGEETESAKMPSLADVRDRVASTFADSFRQPGEPELEFSLGKSESREKQASTSSKEQQRRLAVKKQSIFLKLFYNGREVCRSKSQPLSQKFHVLISQRFAVRILEWPESLMLEMHEDSGSFSRNLVLPGVYLPFPNSFTAVDNCDVRRQEFSSEIAVSYGHAGVGSGREIVPYPDGSEYSNRPVCLVTSGTIAYRIGWAEHRGEILAPPERLWSSKSREEGSMHLSEVLGAGGAFDLSKLQEWAEKSRLDPNDPQNSVFFHFLHQAAECERMERPHFRVDPLRGDHELCSESEVEDNSRLKLLRLRDAGEPEFRGIKMVPLGDKRIDKDVFRAYEKRVLTPRQTLEVATADPLDGHRAWGKKYLQQVRQKVLKECRLARERKRFREIVSEESVPDLGTLGLTFVRWLRPKRPLRPVRKERKRIAPQNLSDQDVEIIVNVVRAFEVPVRKDVDGLSAVGSIDGFSLVNVRPFVEVSFRGVKARTTAADGANPTWNQDLQIPLRIRSDDLSSVGLHSVGDSVYLHLFDEIVVDLIADESQRENSVHQRFERHWLAGLEIPFSTLCFNSRIEGTFKLYSPPVLIGYEREAHRRQFSGSTSREPLLPQRDATYITLFVTVQPPLNPPDPLKEKLESSEIRELEKHLEDWQREVSELCPHRKVKTLVIDITGKTVCVTRFVKPLRPPRMFEEDADDAVVTPEMAARYVAMIPSVAGSTLFPGLFDIWLTADQVLQLLWGDSEDHALLLCSYFLDLGMKAYVLLGSGIPHGSAAYVFVRGDGSGEDRVWDATTGQKYDISDSFCPLQKIYCLFNDQNIWANIQPEEMPRRTRFDLTKRTDWFPAFGKNVTAPAGTVQPDNLVYRPTSRQAAEILRDKTEKRLRDSIMKWRKKRRTRWNRYCSGTLRKLLPELERSHWNAKENQSPDHILELQHILASHKMCGFPINMAYTDVDAIVEAVKATGVHCSENEDVEFALSVYVHPYPNDVLSVWIYVASLVRRR